MIGRALAIAMIQTVFVATAHAACPQVPDRSDRIAAIYERLQAAPSESEGRRINNELWAIWTEAPDAFAQSLLDEGMARRESYDFEGAIAQFDALIAYCPDYAEGWNQRAFVHFLRSDHALALADLEKALSLDPDHTGAMSGQALALLSLGRTLAGQAVLREAVALNPWLPERGYLIPRNEE
ncbi:tetratricopeptide repeat protein [Roseitalea porphyridii]|nr:tetratricopeptide repeat protein [Roseitalea porphyridii]